MTLTARRTISEARKRGQAPGRHERRQAADREKRDKQQRQEMKEERLIVEPQAFDCYRNRQSGARCSLGARCSVLMEDRRMDRNPSRPTAVDAGIRIDLIAAAAPRWR